MCGLSLRLTAAGCLRSDALSINASDNKIVGLGFCNQQSFRGSKPLGSHRFFLSVAPAMNLQSFTMASLDRTTWKANVEQFCRHSTIAAEAGKFIGHHRATNHCTDRPSRCSKPGDCQGLEIRGPFRKQSVYPRHHPEANKRAQVSNTSIVSCFMIAPVRVVRL